MFICGYCNKPSEAGEKLFVIPIAVKAHEHPAREKAHPRKRNFDGIMQHQADPGGAGQQVAQELKGHERCVKQAALSVLPIATGKLEALLKRAIE